MKIAATIVRESAASFLAWSPSLPDNWQVREKSFQDAFKRLEDAIYAFYDVFLGLPKPVFWLNVLDAAEDAKPSFHRSLVVVTGSHPQAVKFSVRPAHRAQDVRLAGDFSQWKPLPMTARGENVFTEAVTLLSGIYEYRYVIDGRWAGSQLHLPEATMVLPPLKLSPIRRHALAGA